MPCAFPDVESLPTGCGDARGESVAGDAAVERGVYAGLQSPAWFGWPSV